MIWIFFLLLPALSVNPLKAQEDAQIASEKQDQTKDPESQRRMKDIQRAANQIYREAIDLFGAGAYWSCARELIILMDFHPEFKKMDGVVFYLGECLYEEELNAAALKMYKYLIKKYPDSEFVSGALFGLEKASYREGNYKDALTIYYRILKKLNNQSILDAARYYAGQSHYYLGNYDTAIEIFKNISGNSEYYDGALYTTGLSHLKRKSISTAIEYLKKIVGLPIISGERRRIVDDARLTLGYIYYEMSLFKEAGKLFSGVSDRHDSYQDALLALGWATLKTENYQETIKSLLKLIALFPESANAEESYFLLGQAYIMLGQFDNSIASYRKITELFPQQMQNLSVIKKVSNSLDEEDSKIEQLKVQILIEESNLLTTLPLNGYSSEVPEYLIKEKERLLEFRSNLVKTLVQERDHFTTLKSQIEKLKKLAERKERRKDWRGYAEYGISRALFLKEMEQKAN